jgi:hypothetical protein
MNRLYCVCALLFMLSAVALSASSDVTGIWFLSVATPLGGGSPTLSMQQNGDNISGTYHGMFGEAPLKGSIKGDEFSVQFNIDSQGQVMTITYTGKVQGDTMSGKVSLGTLGEGTFNGSKKK